MRPLITADFITADSLNNTVQKPKKAKPAKQATDPPKPNPDETWQKRMNDKFKHKPRDKAKETPEGTFTGSPSKIAQDLKNHSPDGYDEAQKKLNSYINRQGRNLQGGDRKRLYDAKDHLKMNYGIHDDGTASASVKAEVVADTEPTIWAPPLKHSPEAGSFDLLGIVPDNREKILEGAVKRLRASVQNSVQNPNTRMSSLEDTEVEVDSTSTVTNNVCESPIAPDEFDAVDKAILAPPPTGTERGSTVDGPGNSFSEINPLSNSAFMAAARTLDQALSTITAANYVDVSDVS